jgi:4'-phosphopantetheinyl transferase
VSGLDDAVRAASFALEVNVVDVVAAPLDVDASTLRELGSTLENAERARAARFRFSGDWSRATAARGWLRRLLGAGLDCLPGDIRFAYGPQGKPTLADDSHGLHFNVSHSEGLALFAFALGREVGVDLERDDVDAPTSVAGNFFSAAELAALNRVPDAGRAQAFLRCWTRKEAFVKACGGGLSIPLDAFDVSIDQDADDALVGVHFDPPGARPWRLRDIAHVSPGFSAALCAQGHDWEPRTCAIELRSHIAA